MVLRHTWAFPTAPSQPMDTGILPTIKRDADDEDIYILAEGLMVSLAGLPDLGPTLFAAFPGSSHETYFLA